ncbi:MAG: fumarylacetoacetase [Terracidiphilus sp.]
MALKSWVSSANDAATDFPIQNLPYGIFRYRERTRMGAAIGDWILDLEGCAGSGLLDGLPEETIAACGESALNRLMAIGPEGWRLLRRRLTELLDADRADGKTRESAALLLVPMDEARMELPAAVGDYTDFYASIHHATRVGKLFRPDNPLLPNYKYVPIGYHGRASSIVVSGEKVRRPCGQIKSATGEPVFGPSRSLDYELEVGAFIGPGNSRGERIPIAEAERHVFGLCLVDDWSARDIQAWEYQPLGPFLAKNFATTISPWVVPMEALEPYRVPMAARAEGDPEPLEYLRSPFAERDAVDLTLEVWLSSARMREMGMDAMRVSQANLRELYWSIGQMVAHHASNGCNLRPGDLLATGTISGPEAGSEGCLLEKRHNPEPVVLPTGERREFLEDGDRVSFRAFTSRPDLPRIGFGECMGTVIGAAVGV